MIPYRENIPIITVRIGKGFMVMNLVKIRSDKNGRKEFINFWEYFDIGMGQLGENDRKGLIHHDDTERCTREKHSHCRK